MTPRSTRLRLLSGLLLVTAAAGGCRSDADSSDVPANLRSECQNAADSYFGKSDGDGVKIVRLDLQQDSATAWSGDGEALVGPNDDANPATVTFACEVTAYGNVYRTRIT